MPCCCSVKTNLTQDPNILKQLNNALSLKYKTMPITNIEQLESTLYELAKGLFKESHGYAWDGINTAPSNMASDARLKALSSFDDINIEKTDDASDALKHILGDGKAPDWLRAQAELDIGTQAIKIFNDAKHGQWNEATFNASYEGPNPGEGPVEARIAFLYTNATLTESGETGTHTILYYLAIYYGPKGSGI